MENTQPTVEWTALQQFWDLMEDDGEAVEDLIQTFLDDAPGNVQKIQEAFAAEQMEELGVLAHTMKGSSATLGVMRFSEYCRQIEAACKNNESIDFAGIIKELTAEFTTAQETLAQWRDKLQAP